MSERQPRISEPKAPLWTCPSCGRRFANTNQWHSPVYRWRSMSTSRRAASSRSASTPESKPRCGNAGRPVVGVALERLGLPLRSRVVDGPDGAVLRLPCYAAAAFGAHPEVAARIGGRLYEGEITDCDEPVLGLTGRRWSRSVSEWTTRSICTSTPICDRPGCLTRPAVGSRRSRR